MLSFVCVIDVVAVWLFWVTLKIPMPCVARNIAWWSSFMATSTAGLPLSFIRRWHGRGHTSPEYSVYKTRFSGSSTWCTYKFADSELFVYVLLLLLLFVNR